jgi:hypothetical protein
LQEEQNATENGERVVGGFGEAGVMMDVSKRCVVNSCADAAVTSFGQQDLCLSHFLSRCYEGLDRLDPRGRRSGGSHAERTELKAFVEECSRRALEVSLSCQNMDNLQRGRLLDILLWAGEMILPESSIEIQRSACGGR